MKSDTFVIHQAVHGYRTGHQLLQSSRQLSSDVQRTMLVLSDLSGPSVVPGFEEYITGYPLESIDTYVLARTWYAPELDRPGCVWTHSLLIEFADMARLEDLATLTQHFRRPSLKEITNPELPAISREVTATTQALQRPNLASAGWLMSLLYGVPDAQVVVLRETSRDLEDLTLAIWSQQWPRLRRTFRFCTGALSVTFHRDTKFDLAISPLALAASLRRDAPKAMFYGDSRNLSSDSKVRLGLARTLDLDTPNLRDELDQQSWIRSIPDSAIASTLQEPRRFRDFCWSFGADVLSPRRAWRGLAEAFAWLGDDITLRPTAVEAVQRLASFFPGRNDGIRLKSEVLFGTESRRLFSTDEALNALAICNNVDAFDVEALDVRRRALSLLEGDRNAASTLLQRLVREPLNGIGETILTALCDASGPSVAMELAKGQRELLPLLVSRSPRLARTPSLWAVPLELQRDMLLSLTRVGHESVREALPAMLAAKADELAGDVALALEPTAAEALLTALDSDTVLLRDPIGRGWQEILVRAPNSVVEWLAHGPDSAERLTLASLVLEPRHDAVGRLPITRWADFAHEALPNVTGELSFRVRAFLLAIAFDASTPEAGRLIAQTYADVYRASSHSSVPYGIWRWFDHLPTRKWYRTWDQCERLSMALVARFAQQDWQSRQFVEAARDLDAFTQALDVADKVAGGEELIRRLRDEVRSGTLNLTSEQEGVLRRHYRYYF